MKRNKRRCKHLIFVVHCCRSLVRDDFMINVSCLNLFLCQQMKRCALLSSRTGFGLPLVEDRTCDKHKDRAPYVDRRQDIFAELQVIHFIGDSRL